MRVASLDIGRMVACLAVVLCHGNMYIGGESSCVLGMAGPLAVMFFMSLSGYVLAYPFAEQPGFASRPFGIGHFFKRRAIKILPAYYVAILTVAICKLIALSPKTLQSVGLIAWNVAAHALFIHEGFRSAALGLNAAWHSMTLEFQYYLLFPALFLVMRKLRSPTLFLVGTVCFSIAYNWALEKFGLQGNRVLSQLCFTRMSEFSAGMALAAYLGQERGFSSMRKAALGFAALAVGLVSIAFFSDALALLGQQALVFVALLLLRLLGPTTVRTEASRWLSFLGRASYSTFLIHVSVGAAFLKGLGLLHMADTTPLRIFVLFLGFTLVGHLAGVLYFYAVEMPGSRVLERWLGASSPLRQPLELTEAYE